MALMANPLTPHQPPRADPPADPSTYYSGCVRAFTPPEPSERATFLLPTLARENSEVRAPSPNPETAVRTKTNVDPRRALFSFSNFLERSLPYALLSRKVVNNVVTRITTPYSTGPLPCPFGCGRSFNHARRKRSTCARRTRARDLSCVRTRVRARVPQLGRLEIAREDALGRARAHLRDVRQGSVVTKRAQGARTRAAHAGPPVQVRRALVRHDLHDAPRSRPAHRQARQDQGARGGGQAGAAGEARGEGGEAGEAATGEAGKAGQDGEEREEDAVARRSRGRRRVERRARGRPTRRERKRKRRGASAAALAVVCGGGGDARRERVRRVRGSHPRAPSRRGGVPRPARRTAGGRRGGGIALDELVAVRRSDASAAVAAAAEKKSLRARGSKAGVAGATSSHPTSTVGSDGAHTLGDPTVSGGFAARDALRGGFSANEPPSEDDQPLAALVRGGVKTSRKRARIAVSGDDAHRVMGTSPDQPSGTPKALTKRRVLERMLREAYEAATTRGAVPFQSWRRGLPKAEAERLEALAEAEVAREKK